MGYKAPPRNNNADLVGALMGDDEDDLGDESNPAFEREDDDVVDDFM